MKAVRYTLLNAKSKIRAEFTEQWDKGTFQHFHTRNILLHIDVSSTPHFIYRNSPIFFHDTYVFTQLRGTDQTFCGMLYDYFNFHSISTNDPINHSYKSSSGKTAQMLRFALHKVPIPESFILREESFKRNVEYLKNALRFPAVCKIDGSKGRNVTYIASWTELVAYMNTKRPRVRVLIQPFIPNTFDTRTIVAYNQILGSIQRTRKGGYLNNIAQGARASRYVLTKEEQEIARIATSVSGVDVGGIDMIHTENGPVVLEVNKSPQIAGFESVHQFSVFKKIAELIEIQECRTND